MGRMWMLAMVPDAGRMWMLAISPDMNRMWMLAVLPYMGKMWMLAMLPDMGRMWMLAFKQNIIVRAMKSDGYKHVNTICVVYIDRLKNINSSHCSYKFN
jgi:hypothetical protein